MHYYYVQLDRVSSIAAKYIGRPITQLPPMQPVSVTSLELSMGSFGPPVIAGPSLDLDLLPGTSPLPTMPLQFSGFSDTDKSVMAECASNAMDELIRLLQAGEPLWMRSQVDGREVLNIESYERMFPRNKNPGIRIEASRDSGMVIMNAGTLVDMFMDPVSTLLTHYSY